MPVCKLHLFFISANAAQEKEKKKKVLQPTGVSKSVAHALLSSDFLKSLPPLCSSTYGSISLKALLFTILKSCQAMMLLAELQ
jgi:hypothetical protein